MLVENKCNNADLTNCIKQQAYELWKKDGCKQGHDMDYWLQAEKAVKRNSKKSSNIFAT